VLVARSATRMWTPALLAAIYEDWERLVTSLAPGVAALYPSLRPPAERYWHIGSGRLRQGKWSRVDWRTWLTALASVVSGGNPNGWQANHLCRASISSGVSGFTRTIFTDIVLGTIVGAALACIPAYRIIGKGIE
jgi:hypothetical protein